jgi:predicted DNA-binding WGR domain protein
MRRFEFVDDRSSKFWEVDVTDTGVTVHYGRIGTSGKTDTKAFGTPEKAAADAESLIRKKMAKGYVEVDASGALAPVAPRAKRALPTGPMTEDAFWDVIGCFDWKKLGDDDAVMRPAVKALTAMTVDDIRTFERLLIEKLHALDTRDICRGIYRDELDVDDGDEYVSADDFLYRRCVIVVNGKACFDDARARPNDVPTGGEFESLLYVAQNAYEAKTGAEGLFADTELSYESFTNAEGWKATATPQPGVFTSERIPPGNRRPA